MVASNVKSIFSAQNQWTASWEDGDKKKHHHKDYMLRMILINKINDQLWLKRTHPLTFSNLKILLSNHKATKNLHKEFQEQYKTFATSFAYFSKIRALSCFIFDIRNCPSKMYKTE